MWPHFVTICWQKCDFCGEKETPKMLRKKAPLQMHKGSYAQARRLPERRPRVVTSAVHCPILRERGPTWEKPRKGIAHACKAR